MIVTDSEYKKLMNRGDNKAIRKSLSTKKNIDLSASCFMMEINSDCSMSSDGKKNKDNKLKPSKHSQEVINDKLTSFVMKGLRPEVFKEQIKNAYVNTVLQYRKDGDTSFYNVD